MRIILIGGVGPLLSTLPELDASIRRGRVKTVGIVAVEATS
jgi:hypothetical protein